jgi:NitT/TauT family transport system substrate-binding protein
MIMGRNQDMQSRRHFMASSGAAGLGALGGANLGGREKSLAAELPPETTIFRTQNDPILCPAPLYVAEELLRTEGFTDIRYVDFADEDTDADGHWTTSGYSKIDFCTDFAADLITFIEAGDPITPLVGLHAGCTELVAKESIHNVTDLKGKTIGIRAHGYTSKRLLKIMVAYVGLDPEKDIRWIQANESVPPKALFLEGKIDAFLASTPQAQELRAQNIGHVIVNSTTDHPWSNYFCCMVWGKTDYIRRFPIATKRALRAILKAADLCVSNPERVARLMVDGGHTKSYDYALQSLNELPYGAWRDYDPEDTLRFFALRMRETGMIKSTPQQITKTADWRFLDDLKRELKA